MAKFGDILTTNDMPAAGAAVDPAVTTEPKAYLYTQNNAVAGQPAQMQVDERIADKTIHPAANTERIYAPIVGVYVVAYTFTGMPTNTGQTFGRYVYIDWWNGSVLTTERADFYFLGGDGSYYGQTITIVRQTTTTSDYFAARISHDSSGTQLQIAGRFSAERIT